MNNIKKPEFVDTFKEEYHLDNTDSLKEAREMMRRRTNQRVWQINQEQREKDRIYFYDCYKKYLAEAIKPDSMLNRKAGEYLDAIEKMGRRAAPFLYELMKNEDMVLNETLEKIYGCKFEEDDSSDDISFFDDEDIYEMKMQYDELKNKWMQKIEEEGDV